MLKVKFLLGLVNLRALKGRNAIQMVEVFKGKPCVAVLLDQRQACAQGVAVGE